MDDLKESEIARMDEVEMASELAQLILQGIRGKSQKELDALYNRYDTTFPEGAEVGRRFRTTMDAIDDLVGQNLHTLAFSRKSLFYTLFSFIYDRMYGLGTGLSKVSSKAKALPARLAAGIKTASDKILHEQLPEKLAEALRGATSHPGTRKTRLHFLKQVCAGGRT
ncbi:MAG: hypothetical protein ACLQNE_43815 [Thermoguttaceae bacterium]